MIVATRGGGDVMLRDVAVGEVLRQQQGVTGGVGVTPRTVAGLPAAKEAIRIASEAVAKLPFRVWRGEGFERKRVMTTWQARLFAGVPNERDSWFGVWEGTEASLTARHNAYWLKARDVKGQVASVYLIHPDNVQARWNREKSIAEYRVRIEATSTWSDWLDSASVLHFRVGYIDPGCIIAPSPLELHREALASAIAKTRYESGLYEGGVAQSLAVMFPREVTPEEAARYRKVFEATHGGIENRNKVRVFGGGVDVKTIGLSLEDSQYVESMQFSVEELARILGVQASLIGGGKTDRPLSPEHEEDRWLRYGLSGRLTRIEQAVLADPSFFGSGARDYPMFDSSGVLRGDLATEADISLKKVQSGQWLVDEARAKDGMPPLPNGAGQVPQIVPVGGAPNPNPTPPPAPADDPDED